MIMNNCIYNTEPSIVSRFLTGEKIPCLKCGKGVYMPTGSDLTKSHFFRCNNCDHFVHWDPVVEIK